MERKEKCRVCGKSFSGENLLNLPDMPGAVQNLPTDKREAIESGVTLDVRQCKFCGLVQLTNDPVPYYKDVIRAGSFSPSMRKRQKDTFKAFIEKFSLRGKSILEIGAGGGEYLSILNDLPVNAFGMEHNPVLNKIAVEKGLRMYNAYPTDLSGPLDDHQFDAFITINFLEHAPDPCNFLRSSASLLTDEGVAMISVPDFEFELQDNYLFSFMSDHLSYFTSESLHNTLSMNGFNVIDVFNSRKLNTVTAYVKSRKMWDLSEPMERFNQFNETINGYLDSILNSGGRIALWGASHLAFSVVSASRTQDKISYIVDSAPFKQGRVAPASGLEIFPPQHLLEDPVNSIIVMSPEYAVEIVADIKKHYSNVVQNIASFINGDIEIIQ